MGNDFLASRDETRVDFGGVEKLIYEARGKQVMLDSDLARLYGCKNGTKAINLAVKRHLDRFPEDFCFQLTDEECRILRFQVETANLKLQSVNTNMRRNRPYVFTEQGVAMLATILRTDIAARVSISIMRAFVAMRKYMATDLITQRHINDLVIEDHERIKLLETSFQKFEERQKDTEIYFDGQIYDAYSKILDIFKEAKNELIIIDSYADKNTLDIIRNINVKVKIVTKMNSLLRKEEIRKFNQQYRNLTVIYNNTFHDRYFIIDNEVFYHCGASINRLGYKTFSITRIGDTEVCKLLMSKVSQIMV